MEEQIEGPACTCPLCKQMVQTEDTGKLKIHYVDGNKCPRSNTSLSRIESSFAEHVLSKEQSIELLNAMKNNSASPKIPIRRLPEREE